MGKLSICILLAVVTLPQPRATAQNFLITTPSENRLQVFWRYCTDHFISDEDSVTSHRFLNAAAAIADSLGDGQLQAYIHYFRMCYRIPFSRNHERHFAPGDYQSAVTVLDRAKIWAQEKGYKDIIASCEHMIGQVYFRAGRYGLAFEHLLTADKTFKEIGYQHVPAASIYLYTLGLDYYRFEEYDKALNCFLAAIRYPTYLPRAQLNTLNAIGLIYARYNQWDQAAAFYRKTIAIATLNADRNWIGIASGNLGNVFLSKGENDSAIYYHRINYLINISDIAPEDGAKSALSIASVFIRQRQPDSALYYIHSGEQLANTYIKDATESLKYRKRFLLQMIDLYKLKGDYRSALQLSDSVSLITDTLQQRLDNKIVNRAVEKIELEGYRTELALLESRKSLSQLRFYLLTATLVLIIAIVGVGFKRYRVRKNQQMQEAEKEKQLLHIEKMNAEEGLKDAEKRLTEYLETLKENNTLITNLDAELQQLKQTTSVADLLSISAKMEKLVSSTILTEEDWRHFRTLFEQVHPGFLARLNKQFSDLSPGETRLLILTKLNLSSREMANMLGVSIDAIRKARHRLRKRLNLDKDCSLETMVDASVPLYKNQELVQSEDP